MSDVRITADILSLELSLGSKILLACLCQRSALNDGSCTDTNKELGEAVRIHPQTISGLLSQLQQADLIEIADQTARRRLSPRPDLLTDYKQFTYPLSEKLIPAGQDTQPPLSNLLTPSAEPSISAIVAHYRPVRTCPVTGLDITHQRADCRLATEKTLKELHTEDKDRFDQLMIRFLPNWVTRAPSTNPRYLAEAIRDYDKQHPSTPTGARHCPITGIDVSRQGLKFPIVTAATIKELYKADWNSFAGVMVRCGLSNELGTPMSNQCLSLKVYVNRQARLI